jgi:hypothetical protein
MIIELNRRKLITGLATLVAAPAIVRVDSLMLLRGVNMDPWVLAFNRGIDGRSKYDPLWKDKWIESAYNNVERSHPGGLLQAAWLKADIWAKVRLLNTRAGCNIIKDDGYWRVMRQSELDVT